MGRADLYALQVGRVAMKWLLFALALAGFAAADTPPRYVIPERVVQGSVICAEYTSASAPRTPNRACVDAATVKAWLLANGRADECH
jgi:hypothetical protein